jgi:hypothetical protein
MAAQMFSLGDKLSPMVDVGLEQAFAKVRAFLEGDFEHPGLTLYDLQNLVGFSSRLKQDGPLSYMMPPET